MTGKGTINFYNGDKYTGEFLNSTISGYGCYVTMDGTKLIGHFDDGMCNKHGKKVYPDGAVYIGEFLNDIEHGKGMLIQKDGKQIKGIWQEAQLIKELVLNQIVYEQSAALS